MGHGVRVLANSLSHKRILVRSVVRSAHLGLLFLSPVFRGRTRGPKAARFSPGRHPLRCCAALPGSPSTASREAMCTRAPNGSQALLSIFFSSPVWTRWSGLCRGFSIGGANRGSPRLPPRPPAQTGRHPQCQGRFFDAAAAPLIPPPARHAGAASVRRAPRRAFLPCGRGAPSRRSTRRPSRRPASGDDGTPGSLPAPRR
jgi:hypothetical protein